MHFRVIYMFVYKHMNKAEDKYKANHKGAGV